MPLKYLISYFRVQCFISQLEVSRYIVRFDFLKGNLSRSLYYGLRSFVIFQIGLCTNFSEAPAASVFDEEDSISPKR
jgi:hypothetical protein